MKFLILPAIAFLALAGCAHRNTDNLEAVKQGVIRDIGKNINVGAMDVNVVSVSFRGAEADAVVSFAPKGGTPAQGLTMNYTMERKDDGWHIKARAQSDLQKHAAQAPPGSMQGGGMQGGGMEGGQMPPGHPSTGNDPMPNSSGGANLPPGHPSLDSKQ